jgi:hypothetical protein
LLSQGAAQAQGLSWLPEQFHVKGDDGTVSVEASARKLAESYTQLQQVTRSTGLPPKDVSEYKIEVPESFRSSFDPSKDGKLGDFLKRAHGAGMTQKHIDMVMGEFFRVLGEVPQSPVVMSADVAEQELSKVWATPEAMKTNIGYANHATQLAVAEAFRGDTEAMNRLSAKFGNDPDFMRFAAYWGYQAREDKSPAASTSPANAQFAGKTLEQLQHEKVTMERDGKTKTPEYQQLAQMVATAFARKFGETPVF